ncbi:unnamed protein product [Parajaminaea phylloscopi]
MAKGNIREQINDDPLVRAIHDLRIRQPSGRVIENIGARLTSTLGQCLDRCRSAGSTRQDLDNLGLWIASVRPLLLTQADEVRTALLADDVQSELTSFTWTKLDSERASISKKAESTAQALLEMVDLVANHSASSGQRSGRVFPDLTVNMIRRANADLYTRTALVMYDILFTVYEPSTLLSTSGSLEKLYNQLTAEFPSKVDIPSRRSRVCIKILRSKGRQHGLEFESTGQVKPGVAVAGDAATQWLKFACKPVISALKSPDKHTRTSTSVHQVAELFALAPLAVLPILSGLISTESAAETMLPAILATLRAARAQSLARVGDPTGDSALTVNEIPLGKDVSQALQARLHSDHGLQVTERPCIVIPFELLSACATSTVEELQVAALSLVVESRSTAAPFSQGEFEVLHAFLEASFSTTHPSGRGAMHSLFGKLLARLNAVTYAAEKILSKHSNRKLATDDDATLRERRVATQSLDESRSFVRSVFEMALAVLHPGSPYHMVIASLTFLELMLVAGADPNFQRQAGGPIDCTFGNFSNSHSLKLQLIDERLVRVLLDCADSTYDDIQARALGLLHRFPAPLPGYEKQDRVVSDIVSKARRLLLSGRESESAAAGHLLRVYQQVYVRRLDWPPALVKDSDRPENKEQDKDLRLLSDLLSFLQMQIEVAEEQGLLVAAQDHPLHGSLIAIQNLLGDHGFWKSAPSLVALRAHLNKAQGLIDRVWNLTRPILCAAAPEGSTDEHGDGAADTEIARALAAAEGAHDPQLTDSLIRKSQVMLSYSWRGMKEAAALLGLLVSAPMQQKSLDIAALWSLSDIEAVGERFTTWMTLIRHRGAFSTVYPALSSAAAAIVRCSTWPAAQRLPKRWLDDFVAGIVKRQQTISTTRRSAGIGYAVLALITAMPLKEDVTPLKETLEALITAADECYGSYDKETVSAHIHAINIIRVLVLDSSLGEAMTAYVDTLLSLSIRRFQSPAWSIRNAALMLFSALGPRAFPARRANEDDLTTQLPANQFFQMYPTLYDALCQNLRASISQGLHKASHRAEAEQAGSLYAVLFLLSRTQAVDHTETKSVDLSALRELVRPCLDSTDYKIREIASRAFACLTTPSEAISTASSMLESCGRPSEVIEENALHGLLLAATRLVRIAVAHATAGRELASLIPCLQMLDLRAREGSMDVREAYQSLAEAVQSSVAETASARTEYGISIDVLRRHLFNCDLDFQARAQAADELFDRDCEAYYQAAPDVLKEDWSAIASLAVTSGCIPLREGAVALLGKLTALVATDDEHDASVNLALVARLVATCGHENQHTESRLAAARCLSAFGAGKLLFATEHTRHSASSAKMWHRSLFKLHITTMELLQDDDEEVRLLAGGVIAGTVGRTLSSESPEPRSTQRQAEPDAIRAGLIRAARGTVASSSVSTQRAWDWLTGHYGVGVQHDTTPWWTQWLVRLVLPRDEELAEAASAMASRIAPDGTHGKRELFAAERPNLYRDYEVDVRRAYDLLRRHGVSAPFVRRQRTIERCLKQVCAVEEGGNASAGSDALKGFEGRLLAVRLVCASSLAGLSCKSTGEEEGNVNARPEIQQGGGTADTSGQSETLLSLCSRLQSALALDLER